MFYKVNKPEVLLANRVSAIRVESLCYHIPSHAQYRTQVQAWNIVHNKRAKLLARLLLEASTTYRTSGGNPLHRQTNSTLLTTESKVSSKLNERTTRGNQHSSVIFDPERTRIDSVITVSRGQPRTNERLCGLRTKKSLICTKCYCRQIQNPKPTSVVSVPTEYTRLLPGLRQEGIVG